MPGATKVGAGIHVAPYALLHDETVVECADGGGAGQQISGIMQLVIVYPVSQIVVVVKLFLNLP